MTPAELAHVARVVRPALVRWAASLVPHRVAEDVAQEALVALTKARESVPLQAAHAWLREAVRRQAMAAWRGMRETPGNVPEQEAPVSDPEVTLVSAQLSVAVREAMDRIEESRRSILTEVMGHDRPLADVAREQGIPESTAQGRLQAGARELRGDLERQRAAERRRTRGSTSWAVLPLFQDVRAALRRLTLLGATVAGGALLISPAENLGPTPEEPIARVAHIEAVVAVSEARAVPAVERAEAQERPRARHDVGARMLRERLTRPE